MSEGVDDPHQEALGEVALARLALDSGDLEHCATHVANAFAAEPTLPEAHEVLTALSTSHFPLEGGVFVGQVVAHAHLLAAGGEPGEALEMLAQASAFDPTRAWADAAWVHELAAERISPDTLVKVFTTLIGALPEKAMVAPNAPYVELARKAVKVHADHAVLHGAASGFARRVGETKLALAWAQRGVELESNMLTEMWWANALRAAGQLDSAIAAMRASAAHEPDNLAIQADIAGWLAEAGRYPEAVKVVDEALTRDPDHDCVVQAAHSIHFAVDGDPDRLVALADFMREQAEQSHEHVELAGACEGLPWLGLLPAGSESCIGAMRGMKASEVPLEMGISTMEVPSALLTFRRAFPPCVIAMGKVGEPDPRLPLRPGVRLWRFDGLQGSPALDPPSEAGVRRLAELIVDLEWAPPHQLYDLGLHVASISADDLLSLLVHSPAVPAGWTEEPSIWERRAQVLCCLGLLHHPTGRALLTDVAFGVEDWTTEAALYALIAHAWADPAVRPEVTKWVRERFEAAVAAAKSRPVTILLSLAQLAFITPGMPEQVRRQARDLCAGQWPANRPYEPTKRKSSFWDRLRRR